MNLLKFLLGLCLGLILLLTPLSQFQPDELNSLRTLAVQLDGRKKPIDTVAKETVAKISGATTYTSTKGDTENYFNTYLSLWFNTRNWNEEPFVLVSYRPLKEAAGLDLDRKRFTFQELMANNELATIVQQAHENQLNDQPLSRNQREALTIEDRLMLLFDSVGNSDLPLVPHPSDLKGTWVSLADAAQLYGPEATAPLAAQFGLMQQALLQGAQSHLSMVGQLATELKQGLETLSPDIYPAASVLQREVHFNHFHPFAKAWMLYSLAFVAMAASFWVKPWNLYWSAMGVFTAGIGVQTYGFFLRMQIAGRPPVTNMYESVVWVGFGIAAIALIFELISRKRYYLIAAAPLSVVCLILADSLPAVLDPSIAPPRAGVTRQLLAKHPRSHHRSQLRQLCPVSWTGPCRPWEYTVCAQGRAAI